MEGGNNFFFCTHVIKDFNGLRRRFRNEPNPMFVEIVPGFRQNFHHAELPLADNEYLRPLLFNNMPDVFYRQFMPLLTPPILYNAGQTNNQILVIFPAIDKNTAKLVIVNFQTLRNFLTVL